MHIPSTLHTVHYTASGLQPLMRNKTNGHACMQAHTSVMAPRIPVSLIVLLHAASMLLTCVPANGEADLFGPIGGAPTFSGTPADYNATRATWCADIASAKVTASSVPITVCDCITEGYRDDSAYQALVGCQPESDPVPEEDAAPPPPQSSPTSTPPPAPATPPAAPASPQLAVAVNVTSNYGATTAGTVNAVASGACAGGPAAIDREAVFDPCCLVAPNAALATTPFTNVANGTVCLPQVTYDLADVEGSGECCAWAYTAGASPAQMSPTVSQDLAVNDALVTSGALKIDQATCRGLYKAPQASEESGSRKLSVHGMAAVLVAVCAVLATAAVV